MSALLTDLYELTMAAGYWQAGMANHVATFELSVRRLPANRDFLLAAGLPQAIDYLRSLRFLPDEISFLRGLPQFSRAAPEFFEALARLRFTGDVWAAPEGTPMFAGEPILVVRAPLMEAQIAETYLLATIAFQSLVATKAVRVVRAAAGRAVVEFGTRRAHSPEAGVLAGRAAYIGGCIGTSNTLTGFRYGVPVYGTAAHSWVLAFPEEIEAHRQLQRLLGPHTIYLVDTFETIEGARKAASLGPPLWGVRLDSGDLAALARAVRRILDEAGLREARIMATGDLDEYKIGDLVAAGAPIDAFGVGTALAASADAPSLGAIYKLVELESGGEKRYTAKLSPDKSTLPGAKQVFRFDGGYDLVGLAHEQHPGAVPLLQPVMARGELVSPLPDAKAARAWTAGALSRLDMSARYRVEYSGELLALLEGVKTA